MRIFPDAALPPFLVVLEFFDEHIFLVCGIIFAVVLVTVLLITLLKKKNGK